MPRIFNGLCKDVLIALLAMEFVVARFQPMVCYFMLVIIYGLFAVPLNNKELESAFVPLQGADRSENGVAVT